MRRTGATAQRRWRHTHMAVWRMDGKPRTARRFTVYKNCPLPTPEDRLLFILIYLKTYALQVVHGRLFGMMQGKAHQWIHGLLPVLLAALRALGDAPAPLPHGPKCFQREIAESIAGRRVEVCGLSHQLCCYAAESAWKHLNCTHVQAVQAALQQQSDFLALVQRLGSVSMLIFGSLRDNLPPLPE